MENKGKILCQAVFKYKITPLALGITVVWWIIAAILCICTSYIKDSEKMIWGIEYYSKHYGTFFPVYCEEGKVNVPALAIICLITIIVFALPFIIFIIRSIIARRCSLSFSEEQIEGLLKTAFGQKKLQMPIDHLDNVMTSNGFMDKVRGGETLLISSNSGLIKFHYVQNAEEFAQAAMKRIGEVNNSAPSAPASAPAPVQNVSGSDAMEKINSLKQMLDGGLISQEDFEAKKADILSKM